MTVKINFKKEKVNSSYKTLYLKDTLIEDIQKIAYEYNTSFNNVIVRMIEYCLKNGF